MKRLFVKTVLALIFSMFLSSPSYAVWTKVTKGEDGYTWYVDFDRIREHNGYVYFWYLIDYPEPRGNSMSGTIYAQLDCKLFRSKWLTYHNHLLPMAGDSTEPLTPYGIHADWVYPPPDGTLESVATAVCDAV